MSNPASTKVHVYIGHPRSLCGHGKGAAIKPFSEFFTIADEDQCASCLTHIKKRGYSIEKLRKQYRALHSQIEPIDQIHAGQEMSHWISRARKIIHAHH